MALPEHVGVRPPVWVQDNLRRLEDILRSLAHVPMTLDQLDRFERALTQAHESNLARLPEYERRGEL